MKSISALFLALIPVATATYSGCTHGEYACTDYSSRRCNWGKWVDYDCPANTYCIWDDWECVTKKDIETHFPNGYYGEGKKSCAELLKGKPSTPVQIASPKEESKYTPPAKPEYEKPAYTPVPTPEYEKPAYTPAPTPEYEKPAYTPAPTPEYEKPAYTPAPTPEYEKPAYTPAPTPEQPAYTPPAPSPPVLIASTESPAPAYSVATSSAPAYETPKKEYRYKPKKSGKGKKHGKKNKDYKPSSTKDYPTPSPTFAYKVIPEANCSHGDYLCTDYSTRRCNWGKWVDYECAKGTHCVWDDWECVGVELIKTHFKDGKYGAEKKECSSLVDNTVLVSTPNDAPPPSKGNDCKHGEYSCTDHSTRRCNWGTWVDYECPSKTYCVWDDWECVTVKDMETHFPNGYYGADKKPCADLISGNAGDSEDSNDSKDSQDSDDNKDSQDSDDNNDSQDSTDNNDSQDSTDNDDTEDSTDNTTTSATASASASATASPSSTQTDTAESQPTDSGNDTIDGTGGSSNATGTQANTIPVDTNIPPLSIEQAASAQKVCSSLFAVLLCAIYLL